MISRRLVASIAAFAVAFAALWPLVSAAKPRDPRIPVFICTQSGEAPHQQVPSNAGDDFHCPLCIASAETLIPVVPMVHAAPAVRAPDPIARDSSPRRVFFAQPPPSRGPPRLS